jgi:hypothetical protein
MAYRYLEENIGSRRPAVAITAAYHTVTFCRDLGYASAPDDFHLYVAMRRNEVLITRDSDFIAIHDALVRLASDHTIADIHSGILVLPHSILAIPEMTRYIDTFFAASLPITNRLYVYRQAGSWVQHHPRH